MPVKRREIAFEEFRLDPANALLLRGQERIALAPKPFEVLRYLIDRHGELVTKDELLDAIWPELHVSQGTLSVTMSAVRSALRDDAEKPRFIETVTRRGYRFIAPVTGVPLSATEPIPERLPPIPSAAPTRSRWWVGRAAMIEAADTLLDLAMAGHRKVVFVTGEAGIGKTTFVEMVMQRMAGRGVDILLGHCIEHLGTDEAFLPLIEALEDRCARPDGDRLVEALCDHAPTWLAQMTKLLDAEDAASLQNKVSGATRERMLREFCEVVEISSMHCPLALVVEDLHWSDFATLKVLSRLARRDQRASVMVLATYRPVDVLIENPPVRNVHQELQIHGRCTEFALDKLSASEVEHYLELRFNDAELAQALGATVFGRTQGQPLFVASLIDHFVAVGAIVQVEGHWQLAKQEGDPLTDGIPNDLHAMITYQFDRLNVADLSLLEAASAEGIEFSAATVAGAVEFDAPDVEQVCEALVRSGRVLVGAGIDEWPDGTIAGRYSFQHALYQEVLYQRLAPAQRASTHRRLGERLEEGYGSRATEVAAVLALHFEQGRDFPKAVHYLALAAENSSRRFANLEAATYLGRALELVDRLPSESSTQTRLSLLYERSWARCSAGDFVGSLDDLRTMIAFAEESGDSRSEVQGLLDFSLFSLYAERRVCLPAAERALTIVAALEDPALTMLAQSNVANLRLILRGWRDEDATTCRRTVEAVRDTQDLRIALRRCATGMIPESLSSHYRDCCIHADKGRELSRLIGDVYYSVFFTLQGAFARLHLGEWGNFLDYITGELEAADNNEHFQASALCRLGIGWLHAEALDFERAREFCEDAIHISVEANPFNFAIGRNLLTKIYLGLGDYASAHAQFDTIVHRLEASENDMDTSIRFHFYHNFSRYWFEIGDLARAHEWAERLYDFSAPAPERTYLALSHRLFAKIALARDLIETAHKESSRAVSIVEQDNLPLAAWRVYATAAEIHENSGELDRAVDFRTRAQQVIGRLAASLPEGSPLQKALLARYPSESLR
jgi:DNA-binding winged helix-turn-helix (wHTH) protein/tetratricopeptide (TPR) repeat protein